MATKSKLEVPDGEVVVGIESAGKTGKKTSYGKGVDPVERLVYPDARRDKVGLGHRPPSYPDPARLETVEDEERRQRSRSRNK